MSNSIIDSDRQVIPRWRSFPITKRLGELKIVNNSKNFSERVRQETFDNKIKKWNGNNNIFNASELIGSAVIYGHEGSVKDAAEYIVKYKEKVSNAALEIANNILNIKLSSGKEKNRIVKTDLIRSNIRLLKNSLNENPKDPISWMDLALAYTSIGKSKRAGRCVQSALHLGEENRFIIRSAARYFIHKDDVERAHELLKNSQIVKYDPWVMAAEVACSQAAKKSSKYALKAIKLLKNKEYHPSNITELASAVGTLEISSGGRRKGKNLIQKSLEIPSENSIAQASWLNQHDKYNPKDTDINGFNNSFEAKVWYSYKEGDLEDSVIAAANWFKDQPFSSRPAIHGSFITACGFENYEKSKLFCEQGLMCNPDNPTLINNLVFALINQNNLNDAQKYISKYFNNNWMGEDQITWIATLGLYNYKIGNTQLARDLYEQTILQGRKKKFDRLERMALLYYANEELELNDKDAILVVKRAIEKNKKTKDPIERILVSRLIRKSIEKKLEIDIPRKLREYTKRVI